MQSILALLLLLLWCVSSHVAVLGNVRITEALQSYDPTPRSKTNSVATPVRERRLIGSDHGKTNGLFQNLGRVWMDASSVKEATIVSKCVKPSQSQTPSNSRRRLQNSKGAVGVGAGPAGLPYCDGGALGGASATTHGVGGAPPVATPPHGGPPSGAAVGAAPTFNDLTAPHTAPPAGSAPTAIANPRPSAVAAPSVAPPTDHSSNTQPNAAPGAAPTVNSIGQPNAAVAAAPASSAPMASNQNAPPSAAPAALAAAAPTASNQNASPSAAPVAVVVAAPMASNLNAPPSAAPAATTATSTSNVCDAYWAGTAPTQAPRQETTIYLTLNINASSSKETSIVSQMGTILRTDVAPMLLNCSTNGQQGVRRRRQLQQPGNSTTTQLVNLVFADPIQNANGSCTQTQANVNCVPVIIKSDLYYLGAAPVQFGGKLRQALLSANFSIDGLLSVGDLQVQQSAGGTPGKATSVGSPTPAPGSNRGTPTPVAVSGIQGTTPNNGGSQANAGAFVAASVAALTLVLVALFVVRRHRNNMSDSVGSKHRELTDDEGDLENETDDISGISPPRSTPRKAYVVSDASLDESWNSNYVRSPTVEIGQEVYLPTQNRNSQAMMQPRNYLLEPHHECASPDCPTCGMARQYGTTTFIPTDDSEAHTHDMPVRNYSAKDTVDL